MTNSSGRDQHARTQQSHVDGSENRRARRALFLPDNYSISSEAGQGEVVAFNILVNLATIS
jgi:hypothetical protein